MGTLNLSAATTAGLTAMVVSGTPLSAAALAELRAQLGIPPPSVGESPNLSSLPPLTQITDDAGAVWTITGVDICKNGTPVYGWRGPKLYWKDRVLYAFGVSGKWFRLNRVTGEATIETVDPTTPVVPMITPPSSGTIKLVHVERDTVAVGFCTDTLVTLTPRAQDSSYFGAGVYYAIGLFFRLDGVKGKAPLIRLDTSRSLNIYAPDWKPCWTHTPSDSYSWQYMEWTNSSASSIGIVTPTFAQDTVYIASHPTMRGSDWDAFLASLSGVTLGANLPMTLSQTDEIGQIVPAQPIRALTIGGGVRRIVLMAGQHGYEDIGDLCLRGAIGHLLLPSSGPLRAAATWHIYPQANPSGRYGGHWRGAWEPGKPLSDPNREWTAATAMDCTTKLRSRILADTGGSFAALVDFHSNNGNGYGQSYFAYAGGSSRAAFIAAMGNITNDVNIPGMASDWAAARGAKIGAALEISWPQTTAAIAAAYGVRTVQALGSMISGGLL